MRFENWSFDLQYLLGRARWDTGVTQRPGMWFAFDMGSEREVTSLVLDSTRSPADYPRRWSVEVSGDGKNWSTPIASGNGDGPVTEIVLPPTRARHVRVSQHGRSSNKFWSIHKLEVFAR